MDHFEDFWKPWLQKNGYACTFAQRGLKPEGDSAGGKEDGCLIAWKSKVFHPVADTEEVVDMNDLTGLDRSDRERYQRHNVGLIIHLARVSSLGSRKSPCATAPKWVVDTSVLGDEIRVASSSSSSSSVSVSASSLSSTAAAVSPLSYPPWKTQWKILSSQHEETRTMSRRQSRSATPALEHIICVANVHLFWNPDHEDVKQWQAVYLLTRLKKALTFSRYLPVSSRHSASGQSLSQQGSHESSSDSCTSDSSRHDGVVHSSNTNAVQQRDLPLLLCGDFNSLPHSQVYEYLTKGTSVSFTHHKSVALSSPKFICDFPLHKHTKWLRAIGLDVEYINKTTGEDYPSRLFRSARKEGRILITRNKRLVKRKGCPRYVLLKVDDGPGTIHQILNYAAAYPTKQPWWSWQLPHRQFNSRCTLCNGKLKTVKFHKGLFQREKKCEYLPSLLPRVG